MILGQLTDQGVNFASVHVLTPVTVQMSFFFAPGQHREAVTCCTKIGYLTCLAKVTFLHVNRMQKMPPSLMFGINFSIKFKVEIGICVQNSFSITICVKSKGLQIIS